jgi:hypothetical protein
MSTHAHEPAKNYRALVRLENKGAFVEAGEIVALPVKTAEILLERGMIEAAPEPKPEPDAEPETKAMKGAK